MNQRIQKQNIREKYWRYSLYVILLGLGTVIFVELIPFLGGLLGALTRCTAARADAGADDPP